jgi:uncharacterized protein (DUF1684 family)
MNLELAQLRQSINQFMGQHPQSPLSKTQQANFEGLDYYDENPALVFQPVVELFSMDEPHIEMETTTGQTRHYRCWGKATFQMDGLTASLVIYSDPWGESLFLPFKDGTNGGETYGAGRYLDNDRAGLTMANGKLQLDFNYAYNPYCAYQSTYSCPLPPRENWLKVPIRSGEKKFE